MYARYNQTLYIVCDPWASKDAEASEGGVLEPISCRHQGTITPGNWCLLRATLNFLSSGWQLRHMPHPGSWCPVEDEAAVAHRTSLSLRLLSLLCQTPPLPSWESSSPIKASYKMQVQSLGWEDPLKKGMATHSSILAWRIPWTEEPSGLQSMGSRSVGLDWSNLAHACTQCSKVPGFLTSSLNSWINNLCCT